MAKPIVVSTASVNMIGSTTKIVGNITSDTDFRIDGTLVGDIFLKGKLVVGASGKIEGNIVCENADFSGLVKGNVTVKELLVLQADAKILGDISVGKLSVTPGAVFSGHCKMETTQTANNTSNKND